MASVLFKQMAICFNISQKIRKRTLSWVSKPSLCFLAAKCTRENSSAQAGCLRSVHSALHLCSVHVPPRIKSGDVQMDRQGKATLCPVFWGCCSSSQQQDLPLTAVQGKGGTAEQSGKSTGNSKLNTLVVWDWVFQTSWFVWQRICSLFHQQKNVDYKFKMQGMSVYKNLIEIPTLKCIHSSKILLVFNLPVKEHLSNIYK